MLLIRSRQVQHWRRTAFLLGALGMVSVHSGETLGIVGKNDWLFLRSELTSSAEAVATAETVSLIGRFNRVLAANGISMVFAMVPVKMRLYAEFLPDNIKLNDYMAGNYERMNQSLQAAGVTVIDLNKPFLNSPLRDSDQPLFYRFDGHWSLVGAKLAADTLKTGMDANPALKKVLEATPEVSFQMKVGKRKILSMGRDLIALVPPNSGTFAHERIAPVSVIRTQVQTENSRAPSSITVQGSSFSEEWTGFVDALRFVLQRDILNVSVPANIGSWFGMERYLSSDAFQTNAPKILIWERPEYTMRAPPNFQYQDARYASDNAEWLLRSSAWVQKDCRPSTVAAKLMPVGLFAHGTHLNDENVVTGPTSDNEFIEFSFDKPIQKLDYLAARVTLNGSKALVLEGAGPGVTTRRLTLSFAGDDAEHALKTPLLSNSRGFTKLRIYPGKSHSFAFRGLRICRQPENILN